MTKALIIGGGIAGPVTAMAVQKAGIESVVYEAYGHDADGVGAFLTLAVNGMDGLRTLDLGQVLADRGHPTPRMAMLNHAGRTLGELPLTGVHNDEPSLLIKRADLYVALRTEAARRRIPVVHGKRLVDAEETATGVRARFADGTEATGDLLVGADGLRSRTRELIDPHAPNARYVPLMNTGGYATGVGPAGEPHVMHMIFGKRCFFSYTKLPNGEVWWFANPPRATEPTPEELARITPQEWRAYLNELFTDDNSPALDLIRHTDEIFYGWNTYDLPPVPRWYTDRMIIVGDAAHATSPSSGQGASMAIEDSVMLARCLRDAPDIPTAFRRYERLRRDRVERIVRHGRRSSSTKVPGLFGRVVLDLMLPIMIRRMAKKPETLAWMYDHHIDWDATYAPSTRTV